MNNAAAATELDPILAAWAFVGLLVIVSVVAIIAAVRAERKKKYIAVRAAHPAGKGRLGLTPEVVVPIRHARRR